MKERYLTDKPQNKTLLESLVAGIDTHNLHREVKKSRVVGWKSLLNITILLNPYILLFVLTKYTK